MYCFILWYTVIISECSFLYWLDTLVLLAYIRMFILVVTRLTCTSYIHIDSHICIGADLILWYILIISERTFLQWLDSLVLLTYILIHTYVLVYTMIYSYHIECSFLKWLDSLFLLTYILIHTYVLVQFLFYDIFLSYQNVHSCSD